MEAKNYRHIADGKAYNSLFPEITNSDKTIKRGAVVEDTVQFIPKVVNETLHHTKKIARKLDTGNTYSTCRNIWNFVYNHIRYTKDKEGFEQIRSPGRTWHDRHRGVDCDCYTVFISSILTNLKIPHKLRITKYGGDNFQHIYPIVPEGKSHITVDCVVNEFNYEEPYSEKKDTTMDLQYLNGIDNMDYDDLTGGDGFGKLFKKKPKTGAEGEKKKGGKLKELLHKGLHITNKLNPGTALLRNGVLAAMKLNLFKIGQRLKWSYLSESAAKSKGIDMARWQRLVKVREKLEKIFYDAGGKPENMKKAVLKGKGNKNNEVSGLGYAPSAETFYMNTATPLRKVLGEDIWQEENVNGLEGLEGVAGIGALGEVATAAAIAAATSVLAAIGGLLKSIGNIFPKKEKGSDDFENTETEDNAAQQAAAEDGQLPALPAIMQKNASLPASRDDGEDSKVTEDIATDNSDTSSDSGSDSGDSSDTGEKQGFWAKNKKWLKPTMFGVGGLGLLFAGYKLLGGKKKVVARTSNGEVSGLNGVKRRKKRTTKNTASASLDKKKSIAQKKTSTSRRKRRGKRNNSDSKKQAVALL
ncbi:MAG TPA: hypothetical protein DDX39_12050 [Bacteroidales bacterium]|nr:MAG: hypothetical protein A2W98_11455 [Bacteroidetes bacterium GWF2_33_38]HBF89364.1 hypothetical protein [Bacteroidales bacterium]